MKFLAAFLMMMLLWVPSAIGQQVIKVEKPDIIQRGNTLIVRKDLGGNVADYMMRYNQMKIHQFTLAIDGECDSSCTLFLGYIPQQATCITANAKLGFHRSNRPEGTMVFLMNYPQTILMWIMAEGLTEDIKFLPDDFLRAMFQKCPSELIDPPFTEKVD